MSGNIRLCAEQQETLATVSAELTAQADSKLSALQEPFKNTAATVMALRTTRSHWHPSLQAAGQNVVIQTAPDARPVPRTALSGDEHKLHCRPAALY